jgi:hypothetical protein
MYAKRPSEIPFPHFMQWGSRVPMLSVPRYLYRQRVNLSRFSLSCLLLRTNFKLAVFRLHKGLTLRLYEDTAVYGIGTDGQWIEGI